MNTVLHTAVIGPHRIRLFRSPQNPRRDAPWVAHHDLAIAVAALCKNPHADPDELLADNRREEPDHIRSITTDSEILALMSPELAFELVHAAIDSGAPGALKDLWGTEVLRAWVMSKRGGAA